MNIEEIISQLIQNTSDIKIDHEPFDHKFIENIFPKEFYLDLIQNIPKKIYYTPINEGKTVDPNYADERFIFNFTEKKDLEKLEDKQIKFFQDLQKILFSPLFFNSITSMFKQTLDNRLLNLNESEKKLIDFPNLKFNFRTALIKDVTKYSLGAHTDSFLKFITFLFYIPSNGDLKNNGTSLYKSLNDIQSTSHFSLEQTKEQFYKVKTCPFIPNSVLIFPRTNKSFHGVEEVNIHQKERNLLLLNYSLVEKK